VFLRHGQQKHGRRPGLPKRLRGDCDNAGGRAVHDQTIPTQGVPCHVLLFCQVSHGGERDVRQMLEAHAHRATAEPEGRGGALQVLEAGAAFL
jgi:hypothetical protein